MVENSLLKVSSRYQVKLYTSFDSIDLQMIRTLIERTISKDFTKKSDDEPVLLHMLTAVANVFQVIKSAWSYLQVMLTVVSKILNEVDQELQITIVELRNVQKSSIIPDSDLEDFKYEFISILPSRIKRDLSKHIENKVLLPVLDFAGSVS